LVHRDVLIALPTSESHKAEWIVEWVINLTNSPVSVDSSCDQSRCAASRHFISEDVR